MVYAEAAGTINLPHTINTEADRASRESHNSNTEWSLDPTIFYELKLKWGDPEIDMSKLKIKNGNNLC